MKNSNYLSGDCLFLVFGRVYNGNDVKNIGECFMKSIQDSEDRKVLIPKNQDAFSDIGFLEAEKSIVRNYELLTEKTRRKKKIQKLDDWIHEYLSSGKSYKWAHYYASMKDSIQKEYGDVLKDSSNYSKFLSYQNMAEKLLEDERKEKEEAQAERLRLLKDEAHDFDIRVRNLSEDKNLSNEEWHRQYVKLFQLRQQLSEEASRFCSTGIQMMDDFAQEDFLRRKAIILDKSILDLVNKNQTLSWAKTFANNAEIIRKDSSYRFSKFQDKLVEAQKKADAILKLEEDRLKKIEEEKELKQNKVAEEYEQKINKMVAQKMDRNWMRMFDNLQKELNVLDPLVVKKIKNIELIFDLQKARSLLPKALECKEKIERFHQRKKNYNWAVEARNLVKEVKITYSDVLFYLSNNEKLEAMNKEAQQLIDEYFAEQKRIRMEQEQKEAEERKKQLEEQKRKEEQQRIKDLDSSKQVNAEMDKLLADPGNYNWDNLYSHFMDFYRSQNQKVKSSISSSKFNQLKKIDSDHRTVKDIISSFSEIERQYSQQGGFSWKKDKSLCERMKRLYERKRELNPQYFPQSVDEKMSRYYQEALSCLKKYEKHYGNRTVEEITKQKQRKSKDRLSVLFSILPFVFSLIPVLVGLILFFAVEDAKVFYLCFGVVLSLALLARKIVLMLENSYCRIILFSLCLLSFVLGILSPLWKLPSFVSISSFSLSSLLLLDFMIEPGLRDKLDIEFSDASFGFLILGEMLSLIGLFTIVGISYFSGLNQSYFIGGLCALVLVAGLCLMIPMVEESVLGFASGILCVTSTVGMVCIFALLPRMFMPYCMYLILFSLFSGIYCFTQLDIDYYTWIGSLFVLLILASGVVLLVLSIMIPIYWFHTWPKGDEVLTLVRYVSCLIGCSI